MCYTHTHMQGKHINKKGINLTKRKLKKQLKYLNVNSIIIQLYIHIDNHKYNDIMTYRK